MKKVLSVIFLSLILSANVSAEIREIEEEYLLSKKSGNLASYKTFCVDGYKFFVITQSKKNANAVSTTQIFEERDGKSLPAKC
jgi:hypothetical protein